MENEGALKAMESNVKRRDEGIKRGKMYSSDEVMAFITKAANRDKFRRKSSYPTGSTTNTMTNVRCFLCGGHGHTARFCTADPEECDKCHNVHHSDAHYVLERQRRT